MQTAHPDLLAIKARLGSLSPTVVSRVSEVSPCVATLLLDCKHLVAYVEEKVVDSDAIIADAAREAARVFEAPARVTRS